MRSAASINNLKKLMEEAINLNNKLYKQKLEQNLKRYNKQTI